MTDLRGCESFHAIEGTNNSLLRTYSASRLSLMAKKSEVLQQLVTHVPDLTVNRLMDSEMELPTLEKNHGVLVFVDVSGSYLVTVL